MSEFSLFFILLLAFTLVGLGWWLFIASEGVYLGRRVVIWLYDLAAPHYDQIKGFNPAYDHHFLARPLLARTDPDLAPYVLDVATGTGRLPLALLHHADFQGPVWALDGSDAMLKIAAEKLTGQAGVLLMQGDAAKLPFADGAFDVVTCLEALEFMTDPTQSLAELCRVLRPGGWLLVTHRRTGRWMPGKIPNREQLAEQLRSQQMKSVRFEAWQVDYDRVWAQKRDV